MPGSSPGIFPEILTEGGAPKSKSNWGFWIIPILLVAALATERLAWPSDLMNNEQQRQAAYVMDLLQNHHLIFQLDQAEEIASKPPLFTWLAAAAAIVEHQSVIWGMRTIAILATAAMAALIFQLARRYWSDRSAFFAIVAYLLSGPIDKQIGLMRMDSLLPLTVALGALAALRAWETGRGWKWFWLTGAASTLTKTPLGLILSANGLIAILWYRLKNDTPTRAAKSHALVQNFSGILIFVGIILGWYFAAAASLGDTAVFHKLVVDELVSQSLTIRNGTFPGQKFHVSLIFLILQYLPWTFPLVVAIVRTFTYPDGNESARRVERFLVCWLLVGLVEICFSPHQRSDLLLPLYPAAALLAGNQVALWTRELSIRNVRIVSIAIVIIGVACLTAGRGIQESRNIWVHETTAVSELSKQIRNRVGAEFPLTHVDDPFSLCVDLNTMRPLYFSSQRPVTGSYDPALEIKYDYDAAINLLASPAAVFICVNDEDDFRKRVPSDLPIYKVAETSTHTVTILSNRPSLANYDPIAFGVASLKIELTGLKIFRASAVDFTFTGSGSAQFTNIGDRPRAIHVVVESPRGRHEQSPVILPNVAWQMTVP